MADSEEKGFVIRDKRGRSESASASSTPPAGDLGSARASAVREDTFSQAQQAGPPISFSSFIFSLGSSALMLMGEGMSPEQPKMPVNLPQAKEIIDILSILDEKTRGNLSSDEATVLADMLYALRLKYVELASRKKESP